MLTRLPSKNTGTLDLTRALRHYACMWQWTESVEQYILDIIFERRRDFGARLTSAGLFGLSRIFQVIVQCRL